MIVILAGHPVCAAQKHLLHAAHGAVKVAELAEGLPSEIRMHLRKTTPQTTSSDGRTSALIAVIHVTA